MCKTGFPFNLYGYASGVVARASRDSRFGEHACRATCAAARLRSRSAHTRLRHPLSLGLQCTRRPMYVPHRLVDAWPQHLACVWLQGSAERARNCAGKGAKVVRMHSGVGALGGFLDRRRLQHGWRCAWKQQAPRRLGQNSGCRAHGRVCPSRPGREGVCERAGPRYQNR